MGDLEVYIECDARDCRARSREIWVKGSFPLSFCGHHADQNAIPLQAQGFNPLESEVLTK